MPRKRRSRRRKQATREVVEEASSNNKKISEETKEAGQGEEEGPTICLYVQHFLEDLNSSMYMIRLPNNLSEHDEEEDQMIDVSDSDSDSYSKQNITILTFREINRFMHHAALVNIGSKIYLFGGKTWYVEENTPASELDTLSRRVQVIDINDPEQEIQSVAPMHTPKDSPCVFVADSMIYAIGTDPLDCTTKLPGCSYTGLFERYNPSTNSWEVLPDPPFFHLWNGAKLLDCATVIGSSVIIGCPNFHAIFHLDRLIWDDTLPQRRAPLFPFGSVFVQHSLYHLSGPDVPRLTKSSFTDSPFKLDTAVTKFPFPAPITMVDNRSLVGFPSFSACRKQTMAQATDLDNNKSFTKGGFCPWRYFFHLGGRFFCHVVTAQLFDEIYRTQYEPCSRAVLIKFFEEVPAGIDNSKCGTNNNSTNNNNNNYNSETKFRTVASFCYKIKTNFLNMSVGTRCSVIGTVPDSWINSPPKKKQESKLKKSEVGQTSYPELEKPVNDKPYETRDLEKLLAAREAEISLLKAELAKEKLWGTAGW